MAPPAPLTAHLTSASQSSAPHAPTKGIHLGRERVKWSEEVWERIDRAVHHEYHRTRVAARFLPHHRVHPHVTTVPQDQILSTINGSPFSLAATLAGAPQFLLQAQVQPNPPLMPNIDEAATTRLIEIWVEFSLTPQQMEQENTFKAGHLEEPEEHGEHEHEAEQHGTEHAHHSHHKHHAYSTAVTLATRAANILSQAQDSILFQGQVATGGPQTQSAPYPANYASPFFTSGLVVNRGYPGDFGLLSIGPTAANLNLPSAQVLNVTSFPPPARHWRVVVDGKDHPQGPTALLLAPVRPAVSGSQRQRDIAVAKPERTQVGHPGNGPLSVVGPGGFSRDLRLVAQGIDSYQQPQNQRR